MKSVWTAPPSLFENALSRYSSALPEKPAIHELESFITDLRTNIPSRKPPHITSAEYQKLITWKLTRGKWRPRLQKFADAITDDIMIPASTEAFASYQNGQKKNALRKLTEMKGCGPASASLVLALVGACFMGDEILEVALGQRKYTDKAFLDLQETVGEKCDQLGDDWGAWEVERAIYAAVKLGISEGRKRAREEEKGAETTRDKRKSGTDKTITKGSKQLKEDTSGSRTGQMHGGSGEGETKDLRRSKRTRKKTSR